MAAFPWSAHRKSANFPVSMLYFDKHSKTLTSKVQMTLTHGNKKLMISYMGTMIICGQGRPRLTFHVTHWEEAELG